MQREESGASDRRQDLCLPRVLLDTERRDEGLRPAKGGPFVQVRKGEAMIGLYRKPSPHCKRCKGTGAYQRRYVMPALFGTGIEYETHSVRCECTDAKKEGE
jgi:hypothetical protein